MAKLDIALTLPGHASLGAFEAGAVSALLVALQRVNQCEPGAAAIDTITGSSSGSLTAVLTAAVLLTGADPVTALHQAWVSEPSLAALQGSDLDAPLSLDRARDVAHRLLANMLLSNAGAADEKRTQQSDVTLELALTSLRGFNYKVRQCPRPKRRGLSRVARRTPASATSYVDWSRVVFAAGEPQTGLTKKWSDAVETAIASASHPLAFPPALLDRSLDDAAFESGRITNLPKPDYRATSERVAELWCSDGGLVDREPLGRCLRLVRSRYGPDFRSRLVLVVRPYPELAPDADDDAWTGQMQPPRWRSTLARALRVATTHTLYEDLRKVEKTNSRIVWTKSTVDTLAKLLPDTVATTRALEGLLRKMRNDKNRWRRDIGLKPKAVDAITGGQPTVRELLAQVLREATGLQEKEPVCVEVIAAGDRSELAGAAVGFVSERLRATNFLVGYEATLRWLEDGLTNNGLSSAVAKAARAAATERGASIPGWIGEIPIGRWPPLRLSAQLLRVGARAVRVGLANPRARERA